MAYCFKPCCAFFWLNWLMALSYLFTIYNIQEKFTYLDIKSHETIFMTACCAIVIVLTCIGCACVKLDVHHACCAIWYVIPNIFATIFFSVAVIISIRSDDGKNIHETHEILRKIRRAFLKTKKLPFYLFEMQTHYGCCGILGFKDYRAFIFPSTEEQDIPRECCRRRKGGKPFCPDMNDIRKLFPRPLPGDIPYPIPRSRVEMKALEELLYGSFPTGAPGDVLLPPADQYLNQSFVLPPDVTLMDQYFLQGCLKEMKGNSEQFQESYFIFSLIFMISSVLMSGLFIYNCVNARHSQQRQDLKHILETDDPDYVVLSTKQSLFEAELQSEDKEQILKHLMRYSSHMLIASKEDVAKSATVSTQPQKKSILQRWKGTSEKN